LQRAGQKALNGYANDAAIAYFSDALHVAKDIHNVKVQYLLLADREQAYSRLGNRLAQADDLAQMRQLALDQENIPQRLETGNRRLRLATDLAEYQQAIAIAEKTLTLARQAHQVIWEARTLTSMGITYWRQGNYIKARDSMLQALASEGAVQDQQLKATCLNYLGLIHTQISEYEQARQDYQQALELYRLIGDKGGEAGCANNLGLLESSLGRYEQAEQYYQQALSICHTIGDRLREGISLNTLGQVQIILGNYTLAKEALEHSLNIRRTIGDRRGEAFCLYDLGYLLLATGFSPEAIKAFQLAGDLRHDLGEMGNYVATLAAQGEAFLRTGDSATAHLLLRQALGYLNQNSGSGEYPTQNIWWIYRQICLALNRPDEANRALYRAYELVKAKADQIAKPELRRSYLEAVRVNAAIVTAMAKAEAAPNGS
jgi:tetratricopeptide (TPR) repeat protein